MPIVMPYTILAGQYVQSGPVRANFQAIADKFNAGIVNADIAPANTANIDGTKLADNTTPGSKIVSGGIGALQLAAGAVGNVALADSTGASDGVTAAKIATGAVTSAKLAAGAALANLAAASIGSDKLKLTFHAVTFTNLIAISLNLSTLTVNPTLTFAKASYDLVGVFVKTISGTASAGAVFSVIPNDSGANWAGTLFGWCTITGSISGSVVYVFSSKV